MADLKGLPDEDYAEAIWVLLGHAHDREDAMFLLTITGLDEYVGKTS